MNRNVIAAPSWIRIALNAGRPGGARTLDVRMRQDVGPAVRTRRRQ